MNRWIDTESDRDQSTSDLPVLPPAVPPKTPMAIPMTESVVEATNEDENATVPASQTKEISGSETIVSRQGNKSAKSRAAKSKAGTAKPRAAQKSPKSKRTVQPRAVPAPQPVTRKPIAGTQPVPTRKGRILIETERVGEGDEAHDSNFQLKQGIPSWLVSFIVHLVLLLVLAILTIGVTKGPDIIGLEMADSEKEIDVVLVDTDLELASPTELDLTTSLPEDPQDELELDAQADLSQEPLDDIRELVTDISQGGGTASELVQVAQGDGKSVRFFGAGAKGTKFVFVIDCSGSMGDEGRWYTATRELKSAISSLRSEQKYYVFLYNSMTYNMTRHKPRLKPANTKNKEACFEWIESHLPMGDTFPRMAMQSALDLRPDAVFFLSDGELKDNTAQYLKVANRQSTEYDQIPIHTIFLGRGFGKKLMERLADQNGGSFTHVRN